MGANPVFSYMNLRDIFDLVRPWGACGILHQPSTSEVVLFFPFSAGLAEQAE